MDQWPISIINELLQKINMVIDEDDIVVDDHDEDDLYRDNM